MEGSRPQAADGHHKDTVITPVPILRTRNDELEVWQPKRDLTFVFVVYLYEWLNLEEVLCAIIYLVRSQLELDEGIPAIRKVQDAVRLELSSSDMSATLGRYHMYLPLLAGNIYALWLSVVLHRGILLQSTEVFWGVSRRFFGVSRRGFTVCGIEALG